MLVDWLQAVLLLAEGNEQSAKDDDKSGRTAARRKRKRLNLLTMLMMKRRSTRRLWRTSNGRKAGEGLRSFASSRWSRSHGSMRSLNVISPSVGLHQCLVVKRVLQQQQQHGRTCPRR